MTRTISLGWDASPSENVVGYRVHYGQESGNYSQVIDAGARTTAEVPNLVEGTTYYFAVGAYAADGEESSLSEEFHYMPNPALLLNLSTRAMVETGNNVMIAGFIVGGMGEKKIVVRALGPSLAASGLEGTLDDPVLEVHGPDGLVIINDNWQVGYADELVSLGLAPSQDAEAAVALVLKPGTYSAVVRGKEGKTGLALLEIYDGGAAPTR